MDAIGNINELPAVNLAQIFENLAWNERLKIEQVCKNWQHVAKNFSWANYRIFDNFKYRDWPESRAMQIQPFFERCGRHLRHLTLRKWSPQIVLSFIRMAPNVVHLKFSEVMLTDESLKELAGIVPELKSFAVEVFLRGKVRLPGEEGADVIEHNLGLLNFFKTMTYLEYINISHEGFLFRKGLYSFSELQFQLNLKFLDLYFVSHTSRILFWVAQKCKNLKGLCLQGHIDSESFKAISQIKSLTYLGIHRQITSSCKIESVFEELIKLRALEIETLDEVVISAIVQHCKKLEHLQLVDYRREFGAEIYATTLRLDSLPNLYSLAIWAEMYSKEQATELINRIIGIGKIQYIGMIAQASLEPEVLLEMLRRCKSIRSVALDFGAIDSDFYSKICQMVDEIDEEDKKQRELPGMTHPIVEVQYNQELAENTTTPYKWLRFKSEIENQEWISAICEKWKFG